MRKIWVSLTALFVVAGLAAFGAPAAPAAESLVNTGSPASPFPQNKQNEPSIAVDPLHPEVMVAGSNDEIDEGPCAGSECPFVQGVGNSGVYFSFDGGAAWTQPTYTGYSDRTGTPGTGPIGTLPHYDTNGLVSDGDPSLAFGPAPSGNGFSWAAGSRLYYTNLASNFATKRNEFTFKGVEAIAVSHTDNLAAAAAGEASAWSEPSIVTTQFQTSATFSDKPAFTADDAATSPYFGYAYVCYSRFQGEGPGVTISFSRSRDGGETWSMPLRLSKHNDPKKPPDRQGCAVKTDSEGNVYVVWEDVIKGKSVFEMARSSDGGATFAKPTVVANVTDVGTFDGVRSISFDGIAGARTSSFPSLSIANGAPSGIGAPNTIALGWSDGSEGLNHEHALVQLSSDGGAEWSTPTAVEEPGERPDFAFVGISPNGTDLYTVYDSFLDPFRADTTSTRRFQGVVRHTDLNGTTLGATTTLYRGPIGDSRASSSNALIDGFLGDYNSVTATDEGWIAVFNDARAAAVCPAIDTFRQEIAAGVKGAKAPAPGTECPPTFGNTDIWSASGADPTP
ncbi:MAG: exo-alpha-sialidase [Actinobacteria bacterium]|nr:exo-alpha-sialidase [Actinomycetota bacterium]